MLSYKMLKNNIFKDLTINDNYKREMTQINFNDLPADIKYLIFKNNRPSHETLLNRHKKKFKNVLKNIKILCDYKNHDKFYEGQPQEGVFKDFNDYVYHEANMIETRQIYEDDDDFKDFKEADWLKYYYSDDNEYQINDSHWDASYYYDEFLYENGHISR